MIRAHKEGLDLNIDAIFKIAAIGILVSVLNQVLKRAERDDIAMLTTLTGLIIVLLMVVNMVAEFFSSVRTIFQLF